MISQLLQRVRTAVKTRLWSLFSSTLGLSTRMVAKRAHVVVHGFPSTEANASELVRGLADSYNGIIHWIDPPSALGDHAAKTDGDRVRPVGANVQFHRYWSARSLLSYITAEAVFYTHGLYGNPVLAPDRTVVNVWHGHGIKQMPYPGYSTHLVVGSKMHKDLRGPSFRVRSENVITSGSPRLAQLHRNPSNSQLERLGINPHAPFVLWLPTYRKSAIFSGITTNWTDTSDALTDTTLLGGFMEGATQLLDLGLQVAVKLHPADRPKLIPPGLISITDDDLDNCRLGLYELLGRSAALITDYSSVWFEYLVLDRPIGFFMPDKATYTSRRGIDPADIFDWLPGPELASAADWAALAAEIAGEVTQQHLRARTRTHIGLHTDLDPVSTILHHLARQGRLRLKDA